MDSSVDNVESQMAPISVIMHFYFYQWSSGLSRFYFIFSERIFKQRVTVYFARDLCPENLADTVNIKNVKHSSR